MRHGLALALVARQQFAEAEEQLSWCLKRRPGDAGLQRMLRDATEKRIDAQGPSQIAARPELMR